MGMAESFYRYSATDFYVLHPSVRESGLPGAVYIWERGVFFVLDCAGEWTL